VWNVKLKGCEENHLRGDIDIQLLGLAAQSSSDTCIGYAMDHEEISNTQRWECLPTKAQEVQQKNKLPPKWI